MRMKLVLFLALAACIPTIAVTAQTPADIVSLWEKEHVTTFIPSNMRHKDLLVYLELLKKSGIRVTQVGTSFSGRSINQMEFGKGPLKVFMWSQMHGDEPTATSALMDIFAYSKNTGTSIG